MKYHIVPTLAVMVLLTVCRAGAAQAQTLKLAHVSIAGQQLPIYIGVSAGLFKKHHLDEQLIYIPGGSLIVQTMVAGEVAAASLSPATAIPAWNKGADLAVIAGGIERLNHMLMVAPKIRAPDDLKGKRVGISRFGSLTDFALGEALKPHKLTPGRDLSVIQLGGLGERVAALTAGLIDGAVVQVDQMFQLERLGYTTLIDLRKLAFHYPTQGIITSRSVLRTKRESLKSFLKVYLEGIKILKTERELPIKTIGKYLKITDPEIAAKIYEVYKEIFERIPSVNRQVLISALSTIPDLSAKAATLNLDGFIDNSLFQELEKDGFIKDLYAVSAR
jgi:NitT/TauT family transport system substrate-binding protein